MKACPTPSVPVIEAPFGIDHVSHAIGSPDSVQVNDAVAGPPPAYWPVSTGEVIVITGTAAGPCAAAAPRTAGVRHSAIASRRVDGRRVRIGRDSS